MADHQAEAGHHAHHVTPISKLFGTYVFLVVFMFLTVFAAQAPYWFPNVPLFHHPSFWILANLVALAIATAKAYQVVQVFMGVKYTTKLVRLFAVGGFVWFLTLFIMFIDYASRSWEPVRGWESGVPSSALPRERTSDGGVPYPEFKAAEGAGNGAGHSPGNKGH